VREHADEDRAGREEPGDGGDGDGEGELDMELIRQMVAEALRDGDEARMQDLARLAIAAFGRAGRRLRGSSASTCSASAARSG
jgi:hypothetical protein